MKFLCIVFLCVFLVSIHSLDNGLGKTPQMGWNSWNKFACNINETLIRETADTLVSSGLAQLGYNYLNLDDCWQISRDADGFIQEDKEKFPSGMKALADYIHSKGLKFGVYSDAGEMTCQKRPGSLGFEEKDAQSYAKWGVDYLKYDNCFNKGISAKKRYPIMRDALNKTGRAIFYSICEWGQEKIWEWGKDVGNSWRTTLDINDSYLSFIAILAQQTNLYKYSGSGGWNDPDMLEVGNGKMSNSEYQAHFALWAILKAPLIIGCDLTKMTSETFKILSNSEIIAVNQDSLGIQAKKVKHFGMFRQVWAAPLADGCTASVFFNQGEIAVDIYATFQELGMENCDKATVRDLINQKDLGVFEKQYKIKVSKHSSTMIKLCPVKTENQLEGEE